MDADGIPAAWPGLLSREQLRAYLGGLCEATLRKVCPVRPVDLGANVYRYRLEDVDAWRRGLAVRSLHPTDAGAQDAPAANDPADDGLDKVRKRVGAKG